MADRKLCLGRCLKNGNSELFVMGKVGKGVKCTVAGCSEDAIRSVSPVDVSRAGLKSTSSGRGYLCKNHYKEMKKKLRKDKELERMRMTG